MLFKNKQIGLLEQVFYNGTFEENIAYSTWLDRNNLNRK